MPMFGRRAHTTSTRTSRSTRRWGFGGRPKRENKVAGLKAALHNPNTTHSGRKNAKRELRLMGHGKEAHGHPSLASRLRHLFHIPSRTTRARNNRRVL